VNRINGLWFDEDITEAYFEKRLNGYPGVWTGGQTLDIQLEHCVPPAAAAGISTVRR
jgi:hypothetical protein